MQLRFSMGKYLDEINEEQGMKNKKRKRFKFNILHFLFLILTLNHSARVLTIRWLGALVGFGLTVVTAQAQPVPPTYKGGLVLTKPTSPWRLDATVGYQFLGSLRLNEGRLRIEDGINWSGSLSYRWRDTDRFTLTYINQPSTLWLRPYGSGIRSDRRLTDLRVHYILAGNLREFTTAGSVRPFAGGQVGMVVFSPESRQYGNETRFAVGLTGGATGPLAGPLGWKVQASMLMPILWVGGGVFCGPGGCSLGLSGGSAIVQLHTNAGLTVSF